MLAFDDLAYGPRVRSAPGAMKTLGDEVRDLAGDGNSVLVVADAGLSRFGLIERTVSLLTSAGLRSVVYGGIAGEPKEAQVDEARRLGRAADARAVVCLGGGSALDAGKLAAALMRTDEPIEAFRLAAAPLPARATPIVCVPTTAGTGSEMTGISVVSDAQKVKILVLGRRARSRPGPARPGADAESPRTGHGDDRHGRAGPRH